LGEGRGRAAALARAAALHIVLVTAALGAGLVPVTTAAAEKGPCPNEQLRSENNSARLPDCRAYELVSTADTNDEDIASGLLTVGGLRAQYTTSSTEGGTFSSTGGEWIAERTPAGWASTNLSLAGDELEGSGGSINGGDPFPVSLSESGTRGVYITVHALAPGDTNEALDVYEGSPDSGFLWLTSGAIRGNLYSPETDMEYEGSNPDLSTVVFQAKEQLLPEAPESLSNGAGGREIYEWHDGSLSLVSQLPGETTGALDGAAVGSGPANEASYGAVSADGSAVFFEGPDPAHNPEELPTQVYARLDGDRTVEISALAPGVSDPEGPKAATFVGATPDGSKAFFTSKGALTATADTFFDTAEVLYEYDVRSATLTALSSADANGPEGSQVGLVGTSENGNLVYFVAQSVLTGPNREGKTPTEGADNLYLFSSQNGATRYIASLNEGDGSFHGSGVWGLANRTRPADVTPDGEHLALVSLSDLTEYESGGSPEMYEYDAEAETLACVSCNPHGPPTAGGVDYTLGGSTFNGTPRFISDDGSQVFFDSFEKLVPGASNGQENVFEYEDGHQYLISSGESSDASQFESVVGNGTDVLFRTRQPLAASAQGELSQLYDARVNGGFTADRSQSACEGTECQGPSTPPPSLILPASATFSAGESAVAITTAPRKTTSHPHPQQTNGAKLAAALKKCRKEKSKARRRSCEKRARTTYRTRTKAKRRVRAANGRKS
jgi:hypothetical protein